MFQTSKMPLFVYGILMRPISAHHYFTKNMVERMVPAVVHGFSIRLFNNIAFAHPDPGGMIVGELVPLHLLPDDEYEELINRIDTLESAYIRTPVQVYAYVKDKGLECESPSWVATEAEMYVSQYNFHGPRQTSYLERAVDFENLVFPRR